MLRIVEPGLSTTVQDTGRDGHYHIGMPPSGAVDQYAHRVANFLVGNEADAATLELTYTGPEVVFEEEGLVAVCGADMDPSLDGEPVPTWTAVRVAAGQTLSFEFATEGARAHLAVGGGADTAPVVGSRATDPRSGGGGNEGRALGAGGRGPPGRGTARGAGRSTGPRERLRRRAPARDLQPVGRRRDRPPHHRDPESRRLPRAPAGGAHRGSAR